MAQAFEGISVVEIGEGVALGYCGKLFADLGADVVKVEPAGGDCVRHAGPYIGGRAGPDTAALHVHLNTNKRSVVVDADRAPDLDLLGRLLAHADLVVDSTVPGTLERWGLGWDTLHARHPDLVLTSVTPFGQRGPYATYRANELVSFAMGGPMTSTGVPDREPVRLPGDCHLYFAGNVAAVASMGALRRVGRGSGGAHVDVSVMETLLGSADWRAALLLGYQFHGVPGRRMPIASGALPSGVYPCADGYVSVMTALTHASRMAGAMENDRLRNLFDDPANAAQVAARDIVEGELYPWLMSHTKAEITEAAQRWRWPVMAVNTPPEVVTAPHLEQRRFWQSTVHPVAGPTRLLGAPYRFEHGGAQYRLPAPAVGEHTRAVAAELAATPGRPDRPDTRDDSDDAPLAAASPGAGRPDTPAEGGDAPLAGIRVVDLSIVWAGPFVTQMLADLGAEVFRVENPYVFPPVVKGVMARPPEAIKAALGPLGMGYAPPLPGMPDRPYNRLAANNVIGRNKRSVTADLRREEGRRIVARLLEISDVLVENFAVGTLERVLGLTTAQILELNPRLVILRLPPFGLTGPWSTYTGFGALFEAMSGFTSLWGYRDSDPSQNSGTAYLDGSTGPAGAFAVLAALEERDRTGRGQLVELSQSENLMQHIGESLVGQANGGGYQRTEGNRDHRYAPQGVYPCLGEDRWVAIAAVDDDEWQALAHVVGGAELATDARFADLAGRAAHHDALDELIAGWTSERDHYEVFQVLQSAGVTAGPVLDEAEVFADPHMAERNFFRPLASHDTGTHQHPGHLFTGIPQVWWRGSPALGEDNDYVYRQVLGLSADEYGELERQGHIRSDYVAADGTPL